MKAKAAGVLSLVLAVMAAGPGSAVAGPTTLARRASRDEAYAGVTVQYAALTDAAGRRLRLILTFPQGTSERLPVIFVAGWLSCDTIEAPPGDKGAPQRLFQALAQLPGFATMRLEKPGVGDSEGDCAATDFTAELAAYQQAFRTLGSYPFADVRRVFVLGLSNGGYVVVGGWIKTWFEHMLEIERRRLALSGVPPAQMDAQMQAVERLYSAYLLENTPPREILARQPELRRLWEGDAEQQYGRPVRYYQQLQQLDLMRAWSQVRAPLLALHGEYDWIMSRADLELMVQLVNQNVPGSARFEELPQTGHTLEHYASQADAFAGKALPFDAALAAQIGAWFTAHR
jgi:pimeloyl-ACP methyl ester carboxylesterase